MTGEGGLVATKHQALCLPKDLGIMLNIQSFDHYQLTQRTKQEITITILPSLRLVNEDHLVGVGIFLWLFCHIVSSYLLQELGRTFLLGDARSSLDRALIVIC